MAQNVSSAVLKIGKLRYLVRVPTNQQPTLAKLYKANPDMPWEEVRGHLTPEALLAERVKDLQTYAMKCDGRHRKVRLFPSPRVFPPTGLSAKAYVKAYYALNQLGTPSHFGPLAEHITYPRGVDSQIAASPPCRTVATTHFKEAA
ncbi:hypothetical protein [Rhodoferax fermentans]|uniref:Uncharacterized protein n=1 Tax=Rhodoferax fermentans TaxID=28066 RepID=A0A1T1AMK5_RHOFE|nr:hypothetical protein [Rhodoferax fermentans]MBK1683965.1 hypothetical protein [Rhodoferax fermentans]OOV05386.1 hypothetical protein RF819_00505 [Rhodoferax fermentans]